MSGSLNKVLLIGNVGADPDIRHDRDGKPWAAFSLATSQRWRDRDTGERVEKTEWHRIVVFVDGLARVCEAHVRKGSKLYLEGEVATRKWRGQDGRDRWSTEIVLSGFNARLVLLGGGRGADAADTDVLPAAHPTPDPSPSRGGEARADASTSTTTSVPAHVAERPSPRARAAGGEGGALELSGGSPGDDDPDDGIPF